MAVFYVDQSIVSGGTGSALSPFGAMDFIAHTNIIHSSNHTYMLRGIRDYTDDPMFNNGLILLNDPRSNNPTFKSWNASLYGPWRMRSNKISFNKALLVYNGIVETSDDLIFSDGFAFGITRDMFIRAGGSILGCRFEGSTVITYGFGVLQLDKTMSFTDCALNCNMTLYVSASSISMNSTACSSGTFGVTGSNNQFNWAPINPFPAWDDGATTSTAADDVTDWEFASLGSLISITGSGDFSNYPIGLFGETRAGVGAFHFVAPPIDRSKSWVFTAGYEGSTGSRKKFRSSSIGAFPTVIHAPPTVNLGEPITENLLTSELRNDDRIIDVGTEYTVVQP